jgi:toxin ParE1/3/4
MPEILLSEFVEPELVEIWATISADQPDAAERFLESAYRTFGLLASKPRMGRRRKFQAVRLHDLRSFRVDGFKNYLIFYEPTSEGIHVFHVYHGARDLEALFR